MKKKLLSFLFYLLVFFCVSGGELVIINGPERKACGFLVQENGKTYLYTSQSAIFGMKLVGVNYSFNASTFKGKEITTKGFLEVSPENDAARIEVDGDFPDAFQLGEIRNIGEEIIIFPDAIKKSSEELLDKVTGIGVYSFTFASKLEENSPGSPVLNNDGRVIGILSAWEPRIEKVDPKRPKKAEEDNKKSKKKKSKQDPNKAPPPPTFEKPPEYFRAVEVKKSLAAIVYPDMKWVNYDEVDFVTAGDALYEAYTLQKEFLPLLNWWYQNPYRLVGDKIKYPEDVRRFVKYNNERSQRMHVFLKKMKKNPRANETMLRGVRDNCVHRAKLFAGFPKSQKENMDIKWKTKFLKDRASRAAADWDFIIAPIECRVKSLEYRLPFKF